MTNIGTWKDKSGNGYDAVATSDFPVLVENAINGRPAVYFETASNRLSMSLIDMTNYTFFMVLKSENPTTNIAYFTNGALNIGFRDNGNEYSFSREPGQAHLPFLKDKFRANVPQVYSVGRTGYTGTITFRINKEDVSTSGTQVRYWTASSNNWVGAGNTYISEVLIYNRELSQTEKELIEDYLMTKYGVI